MNAFYFISQNPQGIHLRQKDRGLTYRAEKEPEQTTGRQ